MELEKIMDTALQFNLLDIAIALITILFLVRGAFRGFVDEVAGLVGFVLAIWLSSMFYQELAHYISPYIADKKWLDGISYILIFILVLILVAICAKILHKFFALTFTAWLDHLAGAIVGFAKGFLVSALIVLIADFILNDTPIIETSELAPYIKEFSKYLINILPIDLLNEL